MLDLTLNTGDGLLAIDQSHKIVLWNAAAQELLGMPPEDALGRSCYEVLRGRDEHDNPVCHAGCQLLRAARKGAPIESRDLLIPTAAGKRAWLNMSTLVLARETPELLLIVHMLRGVEQHRRLERLACRLMQTVSEFEKPADDTVVARETGELGQRELSPRELEVLRLIVRGVDTRSIAAMLCVSEGTARKHVQSVLHKLHLHSRVEAAVFALEHRLIDPVAR